MDCNHARLLLTFTYKNAELDAAEAEALQAHLDQCPECEASARGERGLDDAIGRAMHAVPVPAGPKIELFDKLASEGRRRLRRSAVRVAIAASILLIVFGFGWRHFYSRPKLTWDAVQTWSLELTDFRETLVSQAAAAPEQVEEWFRAQGIAMEAPRQFNYAFLKSCDTALCMKRTVPRLVFAGDDRGQLTMAEVYVLSENEFDLTELKDELEREKELRMPASRYTVQVLPSSGSFIFVIISQGGLELFDNRPSA
jgi:hypothetical protein